LWTIEGALRGGRHGRGKKARWTDLTQGVPPADFSEGRLRVPGARLRARQPSFASGEKAGGPATRPLWATGYRLVSLIFLRFCSISITFVAFEVDFWCETGAVYGHMS